MTPATNAQPAAQSPDRVDQLIAFFVAQCDGKLGRTQLIKMLYLADYEARRYLGRPISDIPYIWYDHGPWHQCLYESLDELGRDGGVREETILYPTGKRGYLYHAGEREVPYSFSPDEFEVLKYVVETYSDVTLQTLLSDIVYETEPMQQAKAANAKNEKLDMSIVDGAKRYELGVAFDELLARAYRGRLGKVVSFEQALARAEAAENAA